MQIALNDFNVFDLLEPLVYVSTRTSAVGVVTGLYRPMTYSAARQRLEYVAFDEDGRVWHLKRDQVDPIGPLAVGDKLFNQVGEEFVVTHFELQTNETRYHSITEITLDPSLALHLRFESTEGAVGVSDVAGPQTIALQNGLNFADHGVPGVSGRALRFAGAAHRIGVDTIQADLAPIGVAFWHRWLGGALEATILDFGELRIWLDPGTQKIRLSQAFSVTDGIWEINHAHAPNVWRHFAITYSRGTSGHEPNFWVNGQPATRTTIQTPSGTITSDAASPRYIGNNALANRPAAGDLDEVRIFDASGLTLDQTTLLAKTLWLIGTINPAQ